MAERKYEKNFIREPLVKLWNFEGMGISGRVGEPNLNMDLCIQYHCIAEPFVMGTVPHKHDFDHVLCFIGGDPKNIREFGAEIEVTLGEEGEKYIINSTTIVTIPAGLLHCPIDFKRVDKPVLFLNIAPSPDYIRLDQKGEVMAVHGHYPPKYQEKK
jgi:hypothetical protein